VFRGYVVAMNPAMPLSGGDATLELQVQDESSALDREQMQKTWGDPAPETDLQILTQLVQPLNLAVDAESAAGASSRSLAQNATPIQFLRERAKANGYELIFAEGKVYFGPMRLSGTAQAPILIYAGRNTNCLAFNITDEAQKPDAVAFATAPRDSGATPVEESVQPDVTSLGSTPAAAEGAGLGTPSVWRITKEKDETEEEVRARAQSLANDNSFKLRATGELDGSLYGHVLRPGRTVTVDGAGDRYGGTYYVDKVTHVFTPEGYRQTFELIRNATGEDGGAGSGPLGAASALASLF
jgi:phage protein D